LNSGNILEYTRDSLNQKKNEMGEISAIINFNCILRTLELKDKNQAEGYGDIFKSVPTVGFSTYGESYIGHINQTSTMVLFQ
ncbi:MAG: FIST C-terminal domain-containing protein, partial [Bacteroidota bacterium]